MNQSNPSTPRPNRPLRKLSLMAADGAEDVADLIVAAHADAKRQIDATQESLMKEAMGPLAGLNIPGLKF